jgi:micrococcal nuclease
MRSLPISLALLVMLIAWPSLGLRAGNRTVLPGVVVGVVDGDTVDVKLQSGMIRIRLHAIDAPESAQPYGKKAKQVLSSLVFGKAVEVEPYEQDRYDRLVARLWLDGMDVNAEMVKRGMAWTYRRYADDPAYCAYEKGARDLKRGLWSLPLEQRPPPWEWRQRKSRDGQFTDFSNQGVGACVASLGKQ